MIIYKVYKWNNWEEVDESIKYYINKINAYNDFNNRNLAQSARPLNDLSYPSHLNRCIAAAFLPAEEGPVYIKIEEIKTEDEN